MVLAIFDFLDPTPSTCLGMTCKAFYPIHRERHGAVHLTTKGLYDPIKKCLWQLLRSFFPGLVFCFEIKKFVTLERCEEIPHVSSFGLERLQESIFRMVEDLPSRSS
ncbi:uncharacterized protein LY89DRAFT_682613 [Mollisia scopiformis]|uniref:F-box domain-containing protein n=1 Tax=Mollisia scopiformis TaxID=149040 RepID=A0A194XHV7_MOLSC|nr:uncharacterized protein LY89DRAFT_682613 [Mollisia scopiformis]KUJ19743.1 hypothetical protein LY89DRAFT_682613 [Mollisia scopiformis]